MCDRGVNKFPWKREKGQKTVRPDPSANNWVTKSHAEVREPSLHTSFPTTRVRRSSAYPNRRSVPRGPRPATDSLVTLYSPSFQRLSIPVPFPFPTVVSAAFRLDEEPRGWPVYFEAAAIDRETRFRAMASGQAISPRAGTASLRSEIERTSEHDTWVVADPNRRRAFDGSPVKSVGCTFLRESGARGRGPVGEGASRGGPQVTVNKRLYLVTWRS